MSLYGGMESGVYKCALRMLDTEEDKCIHLKRELELAKESKSLSEKDIYILERDISEKEEDIKKCKERYDFSLCKNCKNEYYLTGRSIKGCDKMPVRIEN